MARALDVQQFTWIKRGVGCADASDLGLPPGLPPDQLFLMEGNEITPLVFRREIRSRDGEEIWGWVYDAKGYDRITIFND
jgi:hypothetical protein